ncbi:MAG: radical SAM protein [Candidatus Bathyarchaeota archaeon]|nr:radical SAM protein [Candidatus Bathyarchaeota archaeon]MDH5495358.1 radical SAM protein [Candidatus Bathyarchaeota archaeon]
MQIEPIENHLLSTVLNPALKKIISKFDIECEKDGSLMVNSLRQFLGDDLKLCERCSKLSNKVATPFYEAGSRIMRTDKKFMKNCFLDPKHGDAWLKGFTLMMKGIEKYGIRIPFTPGGPFEVVWNFTHVCNLKCKHCYEDAGEYKPELSTEEAFLAIDKLSKIASTGLPALSFSGGEPLMRKDFFEVAAYAHKKISYLSVATNGTLLTKDNAKRLKDLGIEYVEISLDGATKEVHEELRRVPGCFEKTMKGIQNSIDEGLDACIATTIHKENIGEFEKIIELRDKLGVRFIHFNYIPTGRAKAHFELDLTPKERLSILEIMGRKIVDLSIQTKEEEEKTGKSNIRVDRFFSTCPQYASVVKKIAKEKRQDFAVSAHYAAMKGVETVANFLGGCGAGRLYMCLEPNGDIKPCVFFPTNEETVRGNILKDNLEQMWDHDEMFWKLRTRENLKSYNVGGRLVGCGSCRDKYICGGCRARSYSYFNGDLDSPDIGCIDNEKIWEKIVIPLLIAPTTS